MFVLGGLLGLHRTDQLQLFRRLGWVTVILNGLPWKQAEIILSFLKLHPSTVFQTPVDSGGHSISSMGFLPTEEIQWSSELTSPIPLHFSSLIPKMLMFTLASPA